MSVFAGKVAVVTGAGSGIGRALALGLAARGAKLALSDINETGLAVTLKQLPTATVARSYPLDVSDADAVLNHAATVLDDFGAVDFLFNNAGATLVGSIAHTSIEEFEWQIGINLWGVVYGTKAFLPAMLDRRQGCIVNISSVFGLVGFPLQGAYNISKFAVRGFTECLWSELAGTGVSAVSVHPGGIRTNIDKTARWVRAAGEEEKVFSTLGDKLLITPPEVCAEEILTGVARGKRRILVGNKARTIFWISRLFPNAYPFLIKLMAR